MDDDRVSDGRRGREKRGPMGSKDDGEVTSLSMFRRWQGTDRREDGRDSRVSSTDPE